MYIISAELNGYKDEFRCKGYSVSDGYIEFWNVELTKHYFISIHKMDRIIIENIDKKEQEGEIKCIT